jgi:tripartite-type tricarboxylate transporter receptor subunit TctC
MRTQQVGAVCLTRRHALALASGFLLPSAAAAADFPVRPIRLVVPFSAGGGIDVVARLLAQGMGERLGQQVLVDNRTGAGGSVGADFVAKSKPDGYTLIFNSLSSAVLNAFLYAALPYDPVKDFVPISEISESPTLTVINAELPARTLAEFIALAKQNQGKFNFGSSGVGSIGHIDGQAFATRTGLKLTHVPYRGASEAIKDLVAGQIQVEIGVADSFMAYIRSGKLRALCVNGGKRMALLPDVPTAAEAGLPDFEMPNWYGLFGPKGMPGELVQRLYRAVADALAQPEMRTRMSNLGADPIGSSPTQLAAYWQEQIRYWKPIVQGAGIKLTD